MIDVVLTQNEKVELIANLNNMNKSELAVETDRIIEQYKIVDKSEGLNKRQTLQALRYRTQFVLFVESSNLKGPEHDALIFIATKKMTLEHFWFLTKKERELATKDFCKACPMTFEFSNENKDCPVPVRFEDANLFSNVIRIFHRITINSAPRKSLHND